MLKTEKSSGLKGDIYHKIQISLTYNSNHIEGSKLTREQTRYIYETNTIASGKEVIRVDDVLETVNHFRCVDIIIDGAKRQLTESFIKKLHLTLKVGTKDDRTRLVSVGDYKKYPNEVGGHATVKPSKVGSQLKKLLAQYNKKKPSNYGVYSKRD